MPKITVNSTSNLLFLYPRHSFANRLCQLSRCASTTPSARNETNINSASLQTEAPLEESALRPLSYHVYRTASQQLPVYHLAKRGGNLHQTRVRKIEGDIRALRDDLQRALSLKDDHIEINQLTRHIIIKGWRKHDVWAFLEQLRF